MSSYGRNAAGGTAPTAYVLCIPGWHPAAPGKQARNVIHAAALPSGIPRARGKRTVLLHVIATPGRPLDPAACWRAVLDGLEWAGLLVGQTPRWCERGAASVTAGPDRRTSVVLVEAGALTRSREETAQMRAGANGTLPADQQVRYGADRTVQVPKVRTAMRKGHGSKSRLMPKVIMALVTGYDNATAARQGGIHPATLYRWLQCEDFCRELEDARRRYQNRGIDELARLRAQELAGATP
jgi:hypothetical protein